MPGGDTGAVTKFGVQTHTHTHPEFLEQLRKYYFFKFSSPRNNVANYVFRIAKSERGNREHSLKCQRFYIGTQLSLHRKFTTLYFTFFLKHFILSFFIPYKLRFAVHLCSYVYIHHVPPFGSPHSSVSRMGDIKINIPNQVFSLFLPYEIPPVFLVHKFL